MGQGASNIWATQEREANVEDSQQEEVVVEGSSLLEMVVRVLRQQHRHVLIDEEEQHQWDRRYGTDADARRASQVHEPSTSGLRGFKLRRHRQRFERYRHEVGDEREDDHGERHGEIRDGVPHLGVEEAGLVEAGQRDGRPEHRHRDDQLHWRVVLLVFLSELVHDVANAKRYENHRDEEAEEVLRKARALADGRAAVRHGDDDHVGANEDADPCLHREVFDFHQLRDVVQLRDENRDRPRGA
mmetsp:Transcript_571/g.1181  ORF Transcript_571/g.1181 Transcript_571/m.1181 type:complete len:243 (+) Transcript_571:757-1485(+)